MKKILLDVVIGIVVWGLGMGWGFAQPSTSVGNTITLNAIPPSPVGSVTVGIATGGQGTSSFCYWVIATYPIGKSIPSNPSCISNVNQGAVLQVSWNPVTGATSYDVVRSNTGNFPSNCSNCLVGNAVTGNTLTDNLAAGLAYTQSSAAAATGTIILDNTNFTQPRFVANKLMQFLNGIQFADGTTQTTAGVGGGGTVTHTVGPLTANNLVVGNGGADVQTTSQVTVTPASGNITTNGTMTTGAAGGVSGQDCYLGSTSGQACVSVPAVAGAPQTILYPTTNPTLNQVLAATNVTGTTQLGWVNPSTQNVSCDNTNPANICLVRDFATGEGLGSNGNVFGQDMHTFVGGSASVTALAAGASTIPSGIQVNTGATINSELAFVWGPAIGGAAAAFTPTSFWGSAATFDNRWITQLNTFGGVAGDNEVIFVGCSDSGPLTLTNAVGIRYLSGTDTQFTAFTSAAGVQTKTNIGVAADTNRHTLRIFKSTTANSIQFFVDGTSVTITTNIPTVGMSCKWDFENTAAAGRTANVFWTGMFLTGMTRP